MMNIVELITQIREKAGEEIYPKIEPELNKMASTIKTSEVKATQDKQAIDRYFAQMKTAEEKESETSKELAKAQKKIIELESDDSVSKINKENADLRAKNEGLQKTVDEHNNQRKERFVSSYKSYADHSDFENIKSQLKIPKADDGKEVDWKDVPEEDIFSNLAVIEKAESFGLFKERKETPSTSSADSKTPAGGVGKGLFPKMSKHRS